MASTHHSPRHSFDFRSDETIRFNPKLPLNLTLTKNYDRRIIILLIVSPICILLFTSIPVFVNFHGVGADIYRKRRF
jgi:hypothetical protein